MTDERLKQLMEQVGMPNSRSLYDALRQAYMEGYQQLEAENARTNARLIELAAQMACRKGMPDPDIWPGWGSRVPQKLWRAAREECDRARDQCADWAYELRKITDASTRKRAEAALAATKPKPEESSLARDGQ